MINCIRSLSLDLGLCRTFRLVFVISEVRQPILGADFLRSFGFFVDIHHNLLSDTVTQLNIQETVSQEPSLSPTLHLTYLGNGFSDILAEFPIVTQACFHDNPVKHEAIHHFETTSPPVTVHNRQLAPVRLKIVHE